MDKKRVMFFLCALIAIFVIPSVIIAASFDCSKASTKTEKAICDDPILSKLDEDMAAVYNKALKTNASDSIRKEQRKWLKDTLGLCRGDKECIQKAYENRIHQLSQSADSLDRAQVGYCSGPPCCQYETSSCSERDNRALIGMSRITKGPVPFCSKLMNSHWSYIPLLIDHTVSQEEAREYLPLGDGTTDIASKAGYFDINNDGKNEYLGWLQLYSGAGQGCDVEIFVELNSERSHIKNSTLSKLLSEQSCSDYNRAFRFEGKTYIENRMNIRLEGLDFMFPNILTEVFIIEGESRRSVCTFKLNVP